jgi:hypothetical protein
LPETFSYRSDSLGAEPVECGKTTNEKLTRILVQLSVSRHDISFHLKNDKDIVFEKFFARFDHDDLQRFLDHLAMVAEPVASLSEFCRRIFNRGEAGGNIFSLPVDSGWP